MTLPLLTLDSLDGYEFNAYPMKLGDGYALLEVARRATLDTATGVVNEPYDCMGNHPMVCNPGPQRQRSCARSLTLQLNVMNDCRIHTRLLTVQDYYPLSTGEGIIVLAKEAHLQERCQGQVPQ